LFYYYASTNGKRKSFWHMGEKTGKRSGRGGGLGPDDFRLWKEFTRDIEPLEGMILPDDPALAQEPSPAPHKVSKPAGKTAAPPVQTPAPSSSQPPQLDARTELRLKRGKMPIEGRLDLHGYNQEQAHEMLKAFLLASHARGKRCLLVITGKGQRGTRQEDSYTNEPAVGILKQKLPQWLSMPPLREIVLKTFQAAPQDGGSGACYIYLKRTRDYTR